MKWFNGPIGSAIAEAKTSRKIFLVFVEGDDEASKLMSEAYNAVSVSDSLKNNCIAIKLPTNCEQFSQFSQIYPVIVVPSSFFIGIDGIPLDIVGGKLSIEEFQLKIENVVELHKQKVIKFEETCNNLATDEQATPPLDDKVERAKQLIEERRQHKAREAQEDEKKKEMEKRRVGKELQKFKEEQQKKEMREWAEERQKEKQEDKLARERIKAQIAQDRADRAARYQSSVSPTQESKVDEPKKKPVENLPQPSTSNSNQCRIQFRLPNASTRTHEFAASDRMSAIFEYVEQVIGLSNVLLATTFPRRQFNRKENGNSTLRELELVPSTVLIIIPRSSMPGTSLSTGGGSNKILAILYALISPLFFFWNFFASFFGRGAGGSPSVNLPPQSNLVPRNRPEESTSRPNSSPTPSTSSGGSESIRPPASTNSASNSPSSQRYSRREGNIHRLSNESQDDDDENNTWNGNSTQQL